MVVSSVSQSSRRGNRGDQHAALQQSAGGHGNKASSDAAKGARASGSNGLPSAMTLEQWRTASHWMEVPTDPLEKMGLLCFSVPLDPSCVCTGTTGATNMVEHQGSAA